MKVEPQGRFEFQPPLQIVDCLFMVMHPFCLGGFILGTQAILHLSVMQSFSSLKTP